MLASFCELFITFRFFISLNFTIACVCSFCCKFAFRRLIIFLLLCAFACEFSINASSELNMYVVYELQKDSRRQQSIKAYDISNRSTSYKAQSYDQNKFSFDSIASQITVLQVKNRKSKFFTLMQIKIDDETRVHQRRRKNHQFRQ